MNRTLLQAKACYEEMGPAEKKVADWLFLHSGEAMPYSITELARQCCSSEATIVRFARRLGFAGYQELKLSLAQELERRVISPEIESGDSCYEILEKICNDTYLSFERTRRTVSPEGLSAAAAAIASARRVVLVGLGSSASVAADASNRFLRAGCNSAAYSDTHMQTIAVSQLGPGDVVMGISQSGASKDIVDALRLGRSRGATTICLTGTARSPIMRQSDIVLLTDTEELRHSALGLNSHMSRLLLLDALCYAIVNRNEERIRHAVEENDATLLSKRIREGGESSDNP